MSTSATLLFGRSACAIIHFDRVSFVLQLITQFLYHLLHFLNNALMLSMRTKASVICASEPNFISSSATKKVIILQCFIAPIFHCSILSWKGKYRYAHSNVFSIVVHGYVFSGTSLFILNFLYVLISFTTFCAYHLNCRLGRVLAWTCVSLICCR